MKGFQVCLHKVPLRPSQIKNILNACGYITDKFYRILVTKINNIENAGKLYFPGLSEAHTKKIGRSVGNINSRDIYFTSFKEC